MAGVIVFNRGSNALFAARVKKPFVDKVLWHHSVRPDRIERRVWIATIVSMARLGSDDTVPQAYSKDGPHPSYHRRRTP